MSFCIFGASGAWGACDFEHGGWATQLLGYVAEKYDNEICNLSVGSSTTKDLLGRLKRESVVRGAEGIIIDLGKNDSSYFVEGGESRVDLGTFERNITQLAEEAKSIVSDVVLLEILHVDESKTKPVGWEHEGSQLFYDNDRIKRYNNVLKKISGNKSCFFVDMSGVLNDAVLEDGVHPNSEGHRKLFEHIRNTLEGINFLHA